MAKKKVTTKERKFLSRFADKETDFITVIKKGKKK